MVSEELIEDMCLGSDWYTFLRELVPSGLHGSCRCRFLHDTYKSDSLLRGDMFADGVPALSLSSFVAPNTTAPCPVSWTTDTSARGVGALSVLCHPSSRLLAPFLALEAPAFQRGILSMSFPKKRPLLSSTIVSTSVMLPCSPQN
ncbi:hypothetical protein ARMGADRAFT_93386 [Armillaria gallica]|uniref:Uncharacterized protein n=1 Tax=Armillaria gallica TaxID=47427 RepID=A0A2H3CFF4_ARMGA|nr:hypothetical protein ARMGADRAFT_93386 [Armillaria gallica]